MTVWYSLSQDQRSTRAGEIISSPNACSTDIKESQKAGDTNEERLMWRWYTGNSRQLDYFSALYIFFTV